MAVLGHGRRGLVSRCTQSGNNVELNFVDSSSAWTPATSSCTLPLLRAKPEASHLAGQAPRPCSTCGPAWSAPRAAGGEPGGGLLGTATSGWGASGVAQRAQHVRSAPALLSRRAEPERGAAQAPWGGGGGADSASSPGPAPRCTWSLASLALRRLPEQDTAATAARPVLSRPQRGCAYHCQLLGGLHKPGPAPPLQPGCEVTDLDPGQKGRGLPRWGGASRTGWRTGPEACSLCQVAQHRCRVRPSTQRTRPPPTPTQ